MFTFSTASFFMGVFVGVLGVLIAFMGRTLSKKKGDDHLDDMDLFAPKGLTHPEPNDTAPVEEEK